MSAIPWQTALSFLLLCSFAIRSNSGTNTTSLVLSQDGKPAATILLSPAPTRSAQFAAAELQYHLRKISGATIPIVSNEAQVVGTRILVGASKATESLGLNTGTFQPQEYLIRFLPDTLVLMGRDSTRAITSNIVLYGNPKWVDGKFGRALNFDGLHDSLVVNDGGFSDEIGSMEAWIWIPAEATDTFGTILRLDGSGPEGWQYQSVQRLPKGDGRLQYTVYDGKTSGTVSAAALPEGWHHVLATHNAKDQKMELFIDGVSQGSAWYPKTGGFQYSPVFIGGCGATAGNPFRGMIDEVRFSTSVRSPGKDDPAKPFAADTNTSMLLHLDEGEGVPRDTGGVVRPPDLDEEQGSCHAVYDFLERFCDVRWYGPTELEMVYPTMPTLRVTGGEIRRAPAIAYCFSKGSHSCPVGIGKELWNNPSRNDMAVFWCRMKRGGPNPICCGHSFEGYYDRFYRKNPGARPDLFEGEHPEYFAQGYPGKPPQMCYSNPGFIQQVIQDARDYFDGKGTKPGALAGGDYFALGAMDNDCYCKCPTCQAELNKAELANPQFSTGYASDYYFGFVNKVAREIKKSHPGKYIATLAYFGYAYHPKRQHLEPNIAVQMCLHVRNWWAPCMEQNDLKVYQGWVREEKNLPLYVYLYYCFPEGNAMSDHFHCFPGFFAHTAARQIKMFAKDGIHGFWTFDGGMVGEQVDAYITFKLFDDPSRDVDQLLDEFFRRYYGAAAGPMQKMYLKMEDIFSNPTNYPEDVQKTNKTFHQTEEIAWGNLGTEDRIAELGRFMQAAKAAAQTEVEKQRVALFERGVWNYMVEGRAMYLAKLKAHPERAKLKSQPPPRIGVPSVNSLSTGGDPLKVDWSKAVTTDKWHTLMGDSTDRKVTARLVHDGQYLYLRFEEPLASSKLIADDKSLWLGDDWEIIFAAQRGQQPYRWFGINSNGTHAELSFGESTINWFRGGVAKSDPADAGRWTVLLSFPLETLLPGGVKPGQKVYVNFMRGTPKPGEHLAWSPTFTPGFHELGRLVELALE